MIASSLPSAALVDEVHLWEALRPEHLVAEHLVAEVRVWEALRLERLAAKHLVAEVCVWEALRLSRLTAEYLVAEARVEAHRLKHLVAEHLVVEVRVPCGRQCDPDLEGMGGGELPWSRARRCRPSERPALSNMDESVPDPDNRAAARLSKDSLQALHSASFNFRRSILFENSARSFCKPHD
jgi:hypothetical protein